MRRSSQLAHAAGSLLLAFHLLIAGVLPLAVLVAGEAGCTAKCCRRAAKSCCCKGKMGAKASGLRLTAPPSCPTGCRFQLAAPSPLVADQSTALALPVPGGQGALLAVAQARTGVRQRASYWLFSRPPPALL